MSAPSSDAVAGKAPATAKSKPSYVSSSGNMLESPPLSARLTRLSDSIYNFIGLYLVSLLSLDPYTAAQNSQFNTVGSGPNAYQERARWGGVNRAGGRLGGGGGGFGGFGSGGSGGGSGGDGRGPGGGGGGGSGRRMGTVDDVRGAKKINTRGDGYPALGTLKAWSIQYTSIPECKIFPGEGVPAYMSKKRNNALTILRTPSPKAADQRKSSRSAALVHTSDIARMPATLPRQRPVDDARFALRSPS
ncbi:uncharacterized protein AB675_11760 [Cyphellophora attinorum]|uniref:Uncharacterized protein n=1 Tax=Cyphellophora attinorum TaxID=1664694 RepID=A0A0N1GZR8_9EURO|nr:uncharacterized protein AB675_11760 [Phialophora attinorum]KPI36806.1 hypothetical protein AB675_11760 [Phialophora attinorum]